MQLWRVQCYIIAPSYTVLAVDLLYFHSKQHEKVCIATFKLLSFPLRDNYMPCKSPAYMHTASLHVGQAVIYSKPTASIYSSK